MISTPGGKVGSNQINRFVPLRMGNKVFKTDLIILDLEGIDIILGMDWMTRHKVTLDIAARAIHINSPTQGPLTLHLPPRECVNSCAFPTIESRIEDIPVVCENADVFLDDLP